LIDLKSQASGSEVPVGIEMQVLLPAGFQYLQVLRRKARKSILPRTMLPVSSAFEGLHPTLGESSSKDCRKSQIKTTLQRKVSEGPHIRRKVQMEGSPRIKGRTLAIPSIVV